MTQHIEAEFRRSRRGFTLILSATICVAFLLRVSATPATAGERTFEISPPIVELEVSPGNVQESQIKITNRTNDVVALEAFVRDFVAGADGDEPRILGEDETSSYSLKSWVLLSEKQFVLKPQEERALHMTIAAPKDAEPGGHYGLVGFTEPNAEIGSGVGVRAGIATLFFVTVPGAIVERAEITKLTANPLSLKEKVPFSLAVKNTGNIHLVPSGTIRITNLFGNRVDEILVNEKRGVILPGSERLFALDWEAKGYFGYYQADASLFLSEKGTSALSGPISLWVIPIKTVAIGVLSLVVFILFLYEFEHLLAHRKRPKEGVS